MRDNMKKFMKKLSSKKGETILETLVALLIIVFSITFLTTAITKSSNVLKDVKKASEGFTYSGEGGNATLPAVANVMNSRNVTYYQVEQFDGAGNYYYYYEP